MDRLAVLHRTMSLLTPLSHLHPRESAPGGSRLSSPAEAFHWPGGTITSISADTNNITAVKGNLGPELQAARSPCTPRVHVRQPFPSRPSVQFAVSGRRGYFVFIPVFQCGGLSVPFSSLKLQDGGQPLTHVQLDLTSNNSLLLD